MNKFSFVIVLFSSLSKIVLGQGIIAGNVEWNSTGKALTEPEIDEKYSFEKKARRGGSFSTYLLGVLKNTTEKVTIKMEYPQDRKAYYLPQEVHVYEDLQKGASNLLDKGFANLYDYGFYKGKRALIISQFGTDLVDYINKNGMEHFNWNQLQLIATSVIDSLQFLHDTGYVHQDIKPDNIMYGVESPKKFKQMENIRVSLNNRLYLIDLGSARKYRDSNGTHYNQTAAASTITATPPYFTRTYRKGLSQSRRDDMESLGYALLMMSGVMLPWFRCKNRKQITNEQNRLCDDLEVVSICRQSEIIDKRVQAAFSTYFILLKRLFTAEDSFYKEPDYEAFKKCFDKDPQGHYFELTGKMFFESYIRKFLRKTYFPYI